MINTIATYLALTLFVGVPLVFIGLHVLRQNRAGLNLTLTTKRARPGDTIEGTVRAKPSFLDSLETVTLHVECFGRDDNQAHTPIYYRHSTPIPVTDFKNGAYAFSLRVPSDMEAGNQAEHRSLRATLPDALSEWTEGSLAHSGHPIPKTPQNSMPGTIAESDIGDTMRTKDGWRRHTLWRVRASAPNMGADVSAGDTFDLLPTATRSTS